METRISVYQDCHHGDEDQCVPGLSPWRLDQCIPEDPGSNPGWVLFCSNLRNDLILN